MLEILRRLRPEVQQFRAYQSARTQSAGENRNIHVAPMDANEAAEAPSDLSTGLQWRRYPDPQPQPLLQRLSEIYNVSENQLLVSRGSDEAIDLLTRAFCEAKEDSILITPPTYGMYEVSARLQGARICKVPLTDDTFNLDCEAIQKTLSQDRYLKIIYLCSPNNPTGKVLDLNLIDSVCKMASDKSLVVVDEAYFEFAGSPSATALLPRWQNLVVLRTLSKAWAQAGLRLGSLLAHPELIEALRKIIAPYPIPSPITQLAMDALSEENQARMLKRVQWTVAQRNRMTEALRRSPMIEDVFDSDANFVFFRSQRAAELFSKLLQQGVRIRDRSADLKYALRVSVGDVAENDRFINSLELFSRGEL